MNTQFQAKAIEEIAEPEEEEEVEEKSPFEDEIEDEEDGADHYDQLAKQYPEHAQMFKEMANDERNHKGLLENCNLSTKVEEEENEEEE